MIEYSNLSCNKGLDFNSYLQIEALSHSSLKQMKNGILPDFKVTDKVRIGKLVDDILTNNVIDMSNPHYVIAKDIANKMTAEIGVNTLKLLTFQISYSAIMSFDGLSINIKGRPDVELGKLATIDFKVTDEKDCLALINYMGYDNQLWNYSKLGKTKNKFIFIYSKKLKKTFFYKRLVSEEDNNKSEKWWKGKILEYGCIG